MNKYFYDLHIHSCLSPCADDDMTPNNIANMGALLGLNIMALTDHNSCKNLPPFFSACKRNGIIPIGGTELSTAEDIHLICLFQTLEDAMNFGEEIGKRRLPIKNKPEIFGNQLILGEEDEVVGTEENLLISATEIPLEEAVKLAEKYGGVAYPAHIDRESNGIIAILGNIPPEPDFTCCEFNDRNNIDGYKSKYSSVVPLTVLSCSDAHRLWDISEAENFVYIEDEPYSSDRVRRNFLEMIKKKAKQ